MTATEGGKPRTLEDVKILLATCRRYGVFNHVQMAEQVRWILNDSKQVAEAVFNSRVSILVVQEDKDFTSKQFIGAEAQELRDLGVNV